MSQTLAVSPSHPDFRSREFLLGHVRDTLAFYHPRCIDPAGGFFHYFKDDGSVYDASHRHLVSSTRFVFNYAMAWREFGNEDYRKAMQHGLHYLRVVHLDTETGGYAWTIRDGVPEDRTNHCYGQAFVLLAYSHALMAGVGEARDWMEEIWSLLEARFWEADHGLYRDEADADWNFSGYRGQNANMHSCEAMIAAFDATKDRRYLDRALTLATSITQRQAGLADGLVWEHYRSDWSVDPDYNRDDKTNIFRPWGFQTGHLTEWAKLLLQLEAHLKATPGAECPDWIVPTARHFFDTAMHHGWDHTHGGLVYGFAPDGEVCDADKYFWVQAESFAAAALLAVRTGDEAYWQWYDRIWAYSWAHMVDHVHGAWYRIRTPDNRAYSDEKSPAGKTDYHTMGACWDVLRGLGA